jgi:type VI protein secretion system component VasF
MMMPQTNSTTSPSEAPEQQPSDAEQAIARELDTLLNTLDDALTEMDTMASALGQVIALFKAGALEGEQGEQWMAQVRDKVMPFVAETQATLRDLAGDIEEAQDASDADMAGGDAPHA